MKTGLAFGDHIRTEKIKRWRFKERAFKLRSFWLLVLLGGTTLFLVGKLMVLQIFEGDLYSRLSDSNRTRTGIIHAPRGVIFDRNGTPLVMNTPGFRKVEQTSNGEIKTVLLSREEALKRIAKGEKRIEIDSLREYPYKDITAHILGYVGQITPDQLKDSAYSDYLLSDMLGKSGIERQYEADLRGINGKQLVEVNAMGNLVRTLGQTEPTPGRDIDLTIDIKLQEKAYEAMKDVQKGAVIVSTPDGEILTLISKPSYDPNLFTLDSTYKTATDSAYQKVSDILLDGENQPLLDRAIAGTYPPGSTFKIITSAAGLENKIINKDFIVKDTGVIKIGQFSFSNWFFTQYGRTDGDVNVVKALARSNDIFFYKLADMVTVDKLSAMGKKFGVGSSTGIDLRGEERGILPTKEWKQRTIGEQWYLGDTFIYGIGQGYLLSTPLQVNTWTEVIANGGSLYQPRLLKSQNGKIKTQKIVNAQNISLIKEGMIQACSTGGTAYPLFDFKVKNENLKIDNKNIFAVSAASGSASSSSSAQLKDFRKIQIACKTGTAQHGGDETKPHAWITAFAPAHDPEIVVTVLVESGGEGSSVAGPIAKKVLEAYFSENNL